MIYQEGGRWRSERTVDEDRQDVDDIVGKLSPEEYVALQALLGELDEGQTEIADTCSEAQWEEVPVPIAEWLENPDLVGETGETIFPVLKQDLIELFTGGYHEVVLCLHPDTRIFLLDGTTPTIQELAEQWKRDATPFWVYSHVNGEIEPAEAIQPRQTGFDDYYRVTLDGGSSFTGNARHQMLRECGNKVMICEMVVGDRLMSFDWSAHDIHLSRQIMIPPKEVRRIEQIGRGPVYCMTVPCAGNFAISTEKESDPTHRSGVLSSNTGAIGWG